LGAIEAVADVAAAVKPQFAFFEQLGSPGVAVLEEVVHAAKGTGLLVVADAKRGDIGSTAEAYARFILDDDGPLGADAVTLSPYLGAESLAPFAQRIDAGKGLFVLVRTSNPGSGRWQLGGDGAIAPRVADWIASTNATYAHDGALGPVGAVIGATVPDEAGGWRARMPSAPFLVPGFGAQGAGREDVRRHFRADGSGALITSSRGVLFPPTGTDADWPSAVRQRAVDFAATVAEVR